MWPKVWGSPERRHPGILTVPKLVPLIAWITTGGPDYLGRTYSNRFQIRDVARRPGTGGKPALGYARGLLKLLSRDFVKGYTRDWDHPA